MYIPQTAVLSTFALWPLTFSRKEFQFCHELPGLAWAGIRTTARMSRIRRAQSCPTLIPQQAPDVGLMRGIRRIQSNPNILTNYSLIDRIADRVRASDADSDLEWPIPSFTLEWPTLPESSLISNSEDECNQTTEDATGLPSPFGQVFETRHIYSFGRVPSSGPTSTLSSTYFSCATTCQTASSFASDWMLRDKNELEMQVTWNNLYQYSL